MTNRISRRAIACALLATTALVASPAIAQSANEPLHSNVDNNGVDLVQGNFQLDFKEASIGSGPAELALVRINTGYFSSQWDRLHFRQTISGGVVTTHIGMPDGSYEIFQGSTNVKANGATVSVVGGTATYTAADGTKMIFSNPEPDDESSNFCGSLGGYPCDLLPDRIIYPDGHTITFSYDVVGCDPLSCSKRQYESKLVLVENSFGYSIFFRYKKQLALYPPPADWYLRTEAQFQRDGVTQATVTYAYPAGGGTDVTDPAGNTWHLTDTSIQRPGESTPFLQADSLNFVTSVTNNGVTTDYNRVVGGSTATMTITDALNHQKVVTSNINTSRPTSIKDELNRMTSYQYDTNGRLTRVTRPEGNYTQLTYDARGNVTETRQVAKALSGLADIVTSASFDASCANIVKCNKPNSSTDAKGNVTNYAYDPTHGGVTSITQPAPATGGVRPQTRYSYTQVTSASGDPVYMLTGVSACQTLASCTGASDETKVTAGYDGYGNMTSLTRANGTGTLTSANAMTYDTMGDLITTDGPLSGTADTTRYRYDAARRTVGVTSPDPDGAGAMKNRAIRLTYRPDGQVSKEELGTVNSQSDADWALFAPLQTVDVTFDGNARPTQQKLSAGGTAYALTQADYDALGRVNCTAVRMNTAVYGSLPASACSLSTQGSFGPDRIGQNVYDNASELTQVKVGVGTTDAANERTLTYSSNGLVSSLLDGENNLTSYVYDGFDRPSKVQYPNPTKGAGTSSTSDYEQLTYDANSNVTSRRLRDATSIAFTYDNLDRVMLKNLPGTEPDVSYGYDNLGRITSASQTGNALSFGYDALSRKTSEGGPLGTTTFGYDAADRRTSITYPSTTALTINYAYLVTGELDTIKQSTTVLADYAYDNLGNRTGVTFGNGAAQAFSYDAVSRLASLSNTLTDTNDLTATFSYNPASQITSTVRTGDMYAWTSHGNGSTSFTQNGRNQQVTIGGAAASWDSKGNLTSEPQSGKTYGYSSENLLTSASGGVTLAYDPAMRLYQTAGAATTRFLYDGLDAIAEYSGSNALQRRFVFDPTTGQPVLWYEGTGTAATNRRYLSEDERGSVISVSSSTGASLGINTYDEYGKPGAANLGRYQYTGQKWIGEASLYDYKARDYLPHLGIFAQTDPIGQAGGANLYAYVGGDPLNLIDRLGLTSEAEPPIVIRACANGGSYPNCYEQPGPGYIGPAPGLGSSGPGDPGTGCRGDCRPINVIGHRLRPNPQPEPPIIVTGLRTSPATPAWDPRLKPIAAAAPYKSGRNYCGGEGGTSLPNNINGVSINDICYAHDICYGASGTPKQVCDARFGLAILLRLETFGMISDPNFRAFVAALAGLAGYSIVTVGGKSYYVPK